MKTLRNLFVRTLVLIMTILVSLFCMINFENSNISSILILVASIICNGGILYIILRNHSEQEIKNIIGLSWIENKFGVNFTEE